MSEHDRRDDARIPRLEDKVDELGEALKDHIRDETAVMVSIHTAIERLAVTGEHQADTVAKMASSIETLAGQNTRVTLLESHRERHEVAMEQMGTELERTEHRVTELETEKNLVKKGIALIWTVTLAAVAAVWTVWTYLKG
jgi:hypothetical protein